MATSMSPAERDRMLMIALPALLIAAGWFAFLRPGKELASARSELQAARAARVADEAFAVTSRQLARNQSELAEIKQEHEVWTARWEQLRQDRTGMSNERVAEIERVTQLLDRTGLELVSDAPGDENRQQQLPPDLEQAIKLLGRGTTNFKPQLWRIRFQGRYTDVVAALTELEEQCPLAVPVQLSMTEATVDSPVRNWTMLLWL